MRTRTDSMSTLVQLRAVDAPGERRSLCGRYAASRSGSACSACRGRARRSRPALAGRARARIAGGALRRWKDREDLRKRVALRGVRQRHAQGGALERGLFGVVQQRRCEAHTRRGRPRGVLLRFGRHLAPPMGTASRCFSSPQGRLRRTCPRGTRRSFLPTARRRVRMADRSPSDRKVATADTARSGARGARSDRNRIKRDFQTQCTRTRPTVNAQPVPGATASGAAIAGLSVCLPTRC